MERRIDWYVLNEKNFKVCYPFACQLVEKAYKNGHAILISTASKLESQAVSDLLWTFRRTAFIPHQNGQDAHTLQVGLITDQNPETHLNLYLPETPTEMSCQRLLQVIPNEPVLRERARQHYRYYQQKGYQLFTHQIK